MACCSSRNEGAPAFDPQAVAPATAVVLAMADAAPPPRARFERGTAQVGSDRPQIPQDGEGPARRVALDAFEMEVETVTNRRFAAFVRETGYVTEAERIGWSPVFRGLLAHPERHPPTSPALPWWAPVEGAVWFAPEGTDSSLEGREDHPVVQVSWNDAQAFAAWAGGALPTEAQWEHAARSGTGDPRFPWGDDEPSDTDIFCNIWQGRFPGSNTLADGYMGTAPARSFQPNASGLYNMAGNVWEWTADPFRVRSQTRPARQRNEQSVAAREKVLKGGSFLCHISYCYRYRIAARSALPIDSSASNCGFRLAFAAA